MQILLHFVHTETSKKDTESKDVRTLYREWSASLSRSGDAGSAILLSELLLQLDRCVLDREMKSMTSTILVQTLCTAHSHMTLQALLITPLPRHLRCNVDLTGSGAWLRKVRREGSYHTREAMDLNSKLQPRARLYLIPHILFTLFGEDILSSKDSLELLQIFIIALRDLLESQVNDAETKCEVTEIHAFVRSLSVDSYEVFYESMLFAALYCVREARPVEFPQMTKAMSTPYDTINTALLVFRQLLFLIVVDFERHENKLSTFFCANSLSVCLKTAMQLCTILKEKITECLNFRSRNDHPKAFKAYLTTSKLHSLFQSSNRVFVLIERICQGVKKGSTSLVKKSGKKNSGRRKFINIECVKSVPKAVLELEKCRTHLQKCLGLLRIDRIEDDQDDNIEKFRPLCEETRRFVSRTNGVFSVKDWISQMSRRKTQTQTQVTKRSREEIENVSRNGNVDKSRRSGGSKFEARVRNPSKQRRIHRFISEDTS